MKPDIEEFLRPLRIDATLAHQLSLELCKTFQRLAAESLNQFLPTPISESILRPTAGSEKGIYLAIDIGGTNLRVGFIELLGNENGVNLNGAAGKIDGPRHDRLRRVLEKSWPIFKQLKNENADHLFAWIGSCIAEVVQEGCETFHLPRDVPLELGVTFSFPMIQHTLAEAILMPMGKGFAITSNLDLGSHLLIGYNAAKSPGLPPISIAAIANDAVATLISFVYQSQEDDTHKAAMGLICGTGCNATIPLKMSSLRREKLPKQVKLVNGHKTDDVRIAVNTEWSINGSALALHKFGLVSKWDKQLDAAGDKPGFQPLEYMTAGMYLGELARLILLDYLNTWGYSEASLPRKLLQRFGLATTFLSHFKPRDGPALLDKLNTSFPQTPESPFRWTDEIAVVVYEIAKAIEVRAAGIIAAATIGLLACAGDIPMRIPPQTVDNGHSKTNGEQPPMDLIVGWTGGCIAHFQDYLSDCQKFLDDIVATEFGLSAPIRVRLSPCHDGGITGAGVLVGASQAKS